MFLWCSLSWMRQCCESDGVSFPLERGNHSGDVSGSLPLLFRLTAFAHRYGL
jgi:hypothetical protein